MKAGERPESSYAQIPVSKQVEERSEVFQKVPSRKMVDFGDSVLSRDYLNYKKQSLKVEKVIPSMSEEKVQKFESLTPIPKTSKHSKADVEKALLPPKVEMKNSGVQGPPNLVYQIFYETLEQNKKGINKRSHEKNKVSLPQPTTIIYNNNKVTQEVIPKSNYETNRSLRKQGEEVNNSIKDIMFNDGLLDAFDDNMSDDHNDNNEILRNLEDKNPLYFKKEFTEVIEEEMLDMNDRYAEDDKFVDVVDLRAYPEYHDPKNQILLKASSLFDNSIIMDNRYITVYCKTEREFHSGIIVVQITLTYKPKVDHLTISSHLLTSQRIRMAPALLINHPLVDSVNQDFIYECREDFEVIEFPKLQLSLSQYHNYVDFLIPIPFSINKFAVTNYNNPDIICAFLEQVSS